MFDISCSVESRERNRADSVMCAVRGYNVPWLIRGQLELYTLAYTNTNRNPNPNVHKT